MLRLCFWEGKSHCGVENVTASALRVHCVQLLGM